jgi:hypothetical protein
MIEPDAKDWTWVIERPCDDCGFDATVLAAHDVAMHVRANAEVWRALLLVGRIVPGRPDAHTWSSLEYACHVRDVYRRYDTRIALMQNEADPLFPNWDQDASAIDDRYDEQDPASVIAELFQAAESLASRLDAVQNAEWSRRGRRSDGASFTIDSIARYMVHDPIHHLWDVRDAAHT